MKVAVLLCLGITAVAAIDLRMCLRNCRMNDHYCRWTGAPGQMGHYCMQKMNECDVGCIQNCKTNCNEKFSTDTCVDECQYRGKMMLDMNMPFNGRQCMDDCMYQAQRCNMRCDDAFKRLGLDRPLMEYIYPEQRAEDWTVRSNLMDNPHRYGMPQFPQSGQPPSFPSSNVNPLPFKK